MHNSWKNLRRKKDEKDWFDETSIERWILRAHKNGVDVPKEVAVQWLYSFIDDDEVLKEYLDIDLTSITFKLETWNIESIMHIKPGAYGEKGRYLPVMRDLKQIGGKIEKSSYGHISSVVDSWLNHGTWRVPPIVLDSKYFLGYKTPYHLVEGYTRLAWFHYYANNPDNLSGIKLCKHHLIWLMTLKG
ncbi:hypothetical protein V7111_07880 [Neobacillus niacini]|uniref:hypothetical protein n=1 Tax=Neobacillus niacini TaxID=86668 RepID=UPI003000E43D